MILHVLPGTLPSIIVTVTLALGRRKFILLVMDSVSDQGSLLRKAEANTVEWFLEYLEFGTNAWY